MGVEEVAGLGVGTGGGGYIPKLLVRGHHAMQNGPNRIKWFCTIINEGTCCQTCINININSPYKHKIISVDVDFKHAYMYKVPLPRPTPDI